MKHASSFAQTNVQLFNQLRSEGYAKPEICFVWKTYEFGMRLFSGLFLPSGKTFIDHLVGTASILAWLRMPVEIVAAGLIHAAYRHGEFGDGREGVSESKRKQVRIAVGNQSEEYVARYDRLVWKPARILILRDTLDQLNPIEREVLLIRLANELEHHLDLGALYAAQSPDAQAGHQRFIERHGPIMVKMAEDLGFLSLAAEMERVFSHAISARLPVGPYVRSNRRMAYLVASRSYRTRLWIAAYQKLLHGCRLASKGLRRLTAQP